MKKLFLSVCVVAALSNNVSAKNAKNTYPNSASRVNMVNRNLRSDDLGDHTLLFLIIAGAGFGAYLLRDTEMESPRMR